MTNNVIKGQVARVLNTRELAINRGAQHGVTEGMRFAILDTAAEDIKDPESGDVLGSVYRAKVRVQVVAVKERLSIARTYVTKRTNVGGTGMAVLGEAFRPPKWEHRYETLRAEDAAWQELSEEQSIVKTGDPVEEIVEQDDVDETESRLTDVGEDLTA